MRACGTPVYMTFVAAPDRFGVRAGTVDEPSRFVPQLDPSLTKYERTTPR